MGDDVKITVIATGFKESQPQRRERMLGNVGEPESRASTPFTPRISPRVPQAPFASEVGASAHNSPVTPPAPVIRAEANAGRQDNVPARASFVPVISELARSVTQPSAHTAAQPGIPSDAEKHESLRISEAGDGGQLSLQTGAAEKNPSQELVPVSASVFDDDFFQKGNDELRAGSQTAWSAEAPAASNPFSESASPRVGMAPEPPAAAPLPQARVPSFAGYADDAASASNSTDELDIPAFLRRSH